MPAPTILTAAFKVYTYGSEESQPIVAAGLDGRFTIFWSAVTGAENDVYNFTYVGNAIGTDGVGSINSYGTYSFDIEANPDAAFLNNGDMVLAYEKVVGGNRDIYFDVWTKSGSSYTSGLTSVLVNGATVTGDQFQPEVARLSDGGFAIAWEDNNNQTIKVQRYTAAGGVNGGVYSFACSSLQTFNLNYNIDLIGLNSGGFAVTYSGATGGVGGSRMSAVDGAGVAIITNVAVSAGTSANNYETALAQSSSGTIGVAFNGSGGSDAVVRLFNSSFAPITGDITLTNAGNTGETPRIAAMLDGRFMVVYSSATTGPLLGQMISSSGALDGLAFTISATGYQSEIETLADGRVVVTWREGAGAAGDIYSAVYDPRETAVSVTGTSGNDYFVGSNFNDALDGVGGADTLIGGAGNDYLDSNNYGSGDVIGDRLDGGDGNDTLWGQGGNDTLLGGNDNDTIYGDYGAVFGNDFINGGDGNDSIQGRGGADTIFGGDDIDTIDAGDGDDSIQGGFFTDIINAGAGNDVIAILNGEWGDNIDGGIGTDRLDLSALTTEIATVSLAGGFFTTTVLGGSNWNIIGVEDVAGGAGGDTIVGNGVVNFIYGNGGNDVLIGGGGNDVIYGGIGADIIYGDDGNDSIDGRTLAGAGDTLQNILIGGNGNDQMIGDGGADYFYGGADNDSMFGLGGNDILIGEAGNDSMTGGSGNDYFFSGTGVNFMYGDDGIDVFISEGGSDLMVGGLDDNFYYRVAAGSCQINGGTGSDQFVGGLALSDDGFYGNDGGDFAFGGNGNDLLLGQGGGDVLIGQNGNDTLDGGAGVNLLWANDAGSDEIRVIVSDGGTQVVDYFEAGGANDYVRILGSSLTSFAGIQNLVANLGVAQGNNLMVNVSFGSQLYLNLGANQTAIWFQGINANSLTSADFLFA
jgi:Ca2+-binding RTX toxin-like protein